MAKLLLIETSTTVCSVALSDAGEVKALREVNNGYAHAENLTLFCEAVLQEAGITFSQLDGISVSEGPGSYTGLRIGLSAAKGFAFALGIPLITIGTLEVMASGMAGENSDALYCPMIDARRMEVYTAMYHNDMTVFRAPEALVVDAETFAALLQQHTIVFSGDGMPKCRELLAQFPNTRFTENGMPSAKLLAMPAEKRFQTGQFADLAYCEPFYLKEYQAGKKAGS